MKDDILAIYKKNILLLNKLEKIVFYFRIQNYDSALRIVSVFINEFSSFIDMLVVREMYFNREHEVVNVNLIMNDMALLLEAQDNKDYVLLADLYEMQISNLLYDLQSIIINTEGVIYDDNNYLDNINILMRQDKSLYSYNSLDEMICSMDDKYCIEHTSNGQFTLAIEQDGKRFYMHSLSKTTKESFELANYWYSKDKSNYIVCGLGLGYHIKELLNLGQNINIEVYESDINIIQLACAFTELKPLLLNSKVKIIYDPNFTLLFNKLKEFKTIEQEFVIHYPSLRNISDISIKETLENYFIQYNSYKNQISSLDANFRFNVKQTYEIVDSLKQKFSNKDLYIVAAGPSLDKNYLYLKELRQKSDSIILATGTVYRKLLNVGIRPDYFIVTDANERVYAQIRGLENETIPMLFLSTAYHGFASNYKGDKYIILQYEYDKSEKYAKEKGVNLYKTGGSVSTTALDIGITLGCKRIVFLGLDLAFTDNFVHATNTSRRELASTDDLRQVEDINGELVYTSKSLDIYRKWIENRIMDVKDIEIIDATEGGAKIKGMKIAKLSDAINNNLK